MKKEWAKAWDEIVDFAESQGGELDRDGHRFFASWHTDTDEVQVWAELERPQYGLRMGPISARFWNIRSLIYAFNALTVARRTNVPFSTEPDKTDLEHVMQQPPRPN